MVYIVISYSCNDFLEKITKIQLQKYPIFKNKLIIQIRFRKNSDIWNVGRRKNLNI